MARAEAFVAYTKAACGAQTVEELLEIFTSSVREHNRAGQEFLDAYGDIFLFHYQRITRQHNKPCLLTRREIEVMEWLALGKTKEEIGFILGVTRHTIHEHVKNIFEKLNVHDKAYAVRKAIGLGLIEAEDRPAIPTEG